MEIIQIFSLYWQEICVIQSVNKGEVSIIMRIVLNTKYFVPKKKKKNYKNDPILTNKIEHQRSIA
jgi:hypothetical protein